MSMTSFCSMVIRRNATDLNPEFWNASDVTIKSISSPVNVNNIKYTPMQKDNFFYRLHQSKKFQRLVQEEGAIIDMMIVIAEARKHKRLTQAQLAKKVGMPQSQLARIESGNHNVTLRNLTRVASALDLKVRVTA